MSKDYYKILGVDKSASKDEIKKAFRKKAHKLHPDKKTGDEAKFKEVNEAYQVVGDEKKRQQYDQFGSNFEQQGGFGGGMNWEDMMRGQQGQGFGGMNFDFGDIGDMFGFGGGGGRRQRRTPKGSDIQVDVEIDLKDAVEGLEKEISLTKNVACHVCTGNGVEPGSSLETCDDCKGQGQVTRVQQTILGPMQTSATCGSCDGKGQIPKVLCKHCGGDGVERKKETLNVKIPAGIDNGQSIRITGKGEFIGKGGIGGDLYVKVHVKSDESLRRDGEHLYSEAHITFSQAVLGDKIKIKTIEGEKTLVIPAGTQSHQQFRLKNLGVPHLQSSARGNQYVDVIVDIPKRPSKKQKKLIEELGEMN